MKLDLSFSPCPNDTFIFDAMVHHKIDTEGLEFAVDLRDVEQLNRKAFQGKADVIKVSFHAFAFLTDQYELLHSGSALGKGCGPLLISKEPLIELSSLKDKKIAIPGSFTTAHFLLNLALPQSTTKVEMVFSAIEDAILSGTVDAGVIIHENRFTYSEKGLLKIIDLGEYWENLTGAPIPLGGIAVKRELPSTIKHKINRILEKSVAFAFNNPLSGIDYIRSHSQEMDEKVLFEHINLYVNNYSLNLGNEGKRAIEILFNKANEQKLIPAITNNLFLEL